MKDLVSAAHMRWRIERDYQDLKQDLGLGHSEGRGWRGLHHHATLSIAAYGFLVAQRLKAGSDAGGKKNLIQRQGPTVPDDYIPREPSARSVTWQTRSQRYACNWQSPSQSPWGTVRIAVQ